MLINYFFHVIRFFTNKFKHKILKFIYKTVSNQYQENVSATLGFSFLIHEQMGDLRLEEPTLCYYL